MKLYEIGVPVTGWQVYQIEANSKEEAVEMVNNGEVDTNEFDQITWDIDTNNWDVEEIKSDE